MDRESFETSPEGVKMPYLRFLSDSASGYAMFAILLIAFIIDARLPGPWASRRIHDVLAFKASDISIPVAVLLGLLSVPLGAAVGLVLNAVGWFLLGWTDARFANCWFR